MDRTFVMAFTVGLLIARAASADMSPSMPKGYKYADPRVNFEGIEQHPDYVFHLRYLTYGGKGKQRDDDATHSTIPVKDSKAFSLKTKEYLTDVYLLAMDRKEFDKRAKEDPTLNWLTDKTEGVLRASITELRTNVSEDVKEVPVITYRISLKDGKLSAELDQKKKSEAGPFRMLPGWAFGLMISLALAWFGLWFAWRYNNGKGRREQSRKLP